MPHLVQSASFGVISLIEDRTDNFSQEIVVAPIPRYDDLLGKIGGESMAPLVRDVAVRGDVVKPSSP